MYAGVTRDEGNAADDVLMVNQGQIYLLDFGSSFFYSPSSRFPFPQTDDLIE